jgi:hypothetical protein
MKWVLLMTVLINGRPMELDKLEFKNKDSCEAVKMEILSYRVFRHFEAEGKCAEIVK